MSSKDTSDKWPNRPLRVALPATVNGPAKPLALMTSEWRYTAQRDFGRIMCETNWPHDLVRSCMSCIHWSENQQGQVQELCMHFNARPPAWVIAFGCDQYYDENEVPF